ncbi:MAG: hypothetical protein ACYS30_05235 [Planctomycetota bacterium]|jgi:hypothetical protein
MNIENKKIQYYLSDGFEFLKEIPKDKYGELVKNNQVVFFQLVFEEHYQICKLNFMDYWHAIFVISENFRLNSFWDRKSLILPSLEINQRIINILSSMRSYEDHISHKLSALFGKESEQYNKFKQINGELYDAFFSYRFLKRLRNYVQHQDLPIKKVGYPLVSISFEPRQIAFTISPKMHKSALIRAKSWGKVQTEIEGMDENIDINPIIEEAFRVLTSLHSQFRKYLSPCYEKAKSVITDLHESKEVTNKTAYLVKSCGKYAMEKEWIQYENIAIIEELMQKGPSSECINFSTIQPEEYIKKVGDIVKHKG